jgi:pimeloyl-ACP methyl ester carboxylesterase
VSSVLVVPGLAVQGYAAVAVGALRAAGFDAELLDPPSWRGVPADLELYGRQLGERLRDEGRPVAVLIGLSVGTQAAAVAAALAGDRVAHLLLVSPTVEPAKRSRRRLLAAWLKGEDHPDSPPVTQQIRDWRHAGAPRILRGFTSAVRVRLEDVLPEVTAEISIVHAEADQLTSHSYAASLAERSGARLLLVPDAPHSWPIGDADRFVTLVSELAA